jgi:hypothetical protein
MQYGLYLLSRTCKLFDIADLSARPSTLSAIIFISRNNMDMDMRNDLVSHSAVVLTDTEAISIYG